MMKEGKKQLAKSYLRKRHLCEKKHGEFEFELLRIHSYILTSRTTKQIPAQH